jgi:MoxR-like ATPase
VYALPEAQRDRFLMKVHVGHPSAMEELAILGRMGVRPPVPNQILSPERVRALQQAADAVFVHHALQEYIVRLVMATRDAGSVVPELRGMIEVGASPRGTLGLAAAARALAVLRRRDYVLPQDVADVATDVLAHRIVLGFEALADGVQHRDVIARLVAVVPAPRIAPAQEPAATQPVATWPTAPQPAATQPVATWPTAPQPVATQPAQEQSAQEQPQAPVADESGRQAAGGAA